jgi:GcrA cell cycle regulator
MSEAATGWTDDRVELLAKLWSEGQSASQIAAVLGGGVTRNAVIGKVHRLGLSGRGKTTGAAPAQHRQPKPTRAPTHPMTMADAPQPAAAAASTPAKVVTPPAATWRPTEVAIPTSERVTILELRDSMCRWPIGDPAKADFGFCGQRSVTGLPYCGAHCQIAYQPATERKRLRA